MQSFYRILLFALLTLAGTGLQAQLSPGDILFVGYMGDGNGGADGLDLNCGDGFAFAALVDIPANTTIHFTEDEWKGTAFQGDEGTVSWVNTAATPAGTVVRITTHREVDLCAPIEASVGTIEFAATPGNFVLSGSNEELYAYLGTPNGPTTWLSAFLTDNSTGENILPTELTGFVIDFTTVDQDVDVAVLNSTVNCGDKAACVAYITNLSNWQTEDEPGAGDCCNDMGIEYPGDLPPSLQNCEQPVINGVTLVDCGNGVSGLVTLAVDGELNGAAGWQWMGLNGTCNSGYVAFDTDTVMGNYFNFIDQEFVVRANGGCLAEPLCFTFVPSQLTGQPAALTLATGTYCADAGVQTGLGGGSPAGGVYSGPGVTDDGNGMTFSFDPAAAGPGSATITYTRNTGTACGDSEAQATIQVAALPTVSFTAPGPFTTTDGIQPLTAGTPGAGTYSGTGVVDNGDGTFSFDPAAAGVGSFEITYSFIDTNGCSASATETITVTAPPVMNGDLCADAFELDSLFGQPIGAAQTSGLYDNTDNTSTGDPTAGTDCFADESVDQTVWFSFTGDGNAYRIRSVACDATNPMTNNDTQFALYRGSCGELTPVACNDDENFPAMVYNAFLELETEAGVDYFLMVDGYFGGEDEYDAIGEFCLEVTQFDPDVVGPADVCAEALAVDSLFGAPIGEAQTSGVYDNDDNTSTGDPTEGTDCFLDSGLDQTVWFSFTGDGGTYSLRSVLCDATNPIEFNDTQFALYRGSCDDLTPVACNEDEDFDNDLFNGYLEVATEAGVDYFLLVDGYNDADNESSGEFCLEVTLLEPSNTVDLAAAGLQVFPNPTTGLLQLDGFTAERTDIFDQLGRRVQTYTTPQTNYDLSELPGGVYYLRLTVDGQVYGTKVVKE
jgi:hypothetical protein